MAQQYPRIIAPFMPQGTPEKTNSPTPFYAPGEIGAAFTDPNTGRGYCRVKLDSGANNSVKGAVAVGDLAYWKDRSAAIVTNDKAQCDAGPSGAINRVAGIFMVAGTCAPATNGTDGQPVQYVVDICIQGRDIPVAASTALIGAQATCDTTASTARTVYTTGVNTAPVSQVIGIYKSSTITNSLGTIDVNVGFID